LAAEENFPTDIGTTAPSSVTRARIINQR